MTNKDDYKAHFEALLDHAQTLLSTYKLNGDRAGYHLTDLAINRLKIAMNLYADCDPNIRAGIKEAEAYITIIEKPIPEAQ